MRSTTLLAALAGVAVSSAALAQFQDECYAAPIVGEGVYSFNLGYATNDYAGSCGATESAPDQWIRYIAKGDGVATISTCGLTGGDTVLTILDGACGAELACLDDACDLQTEISLPVVAGHVYSIRIAGYWGQTFSGQVSITRPNDRCADATIVEDGVYDFDNSAADTDGSATCGYNTGHDLWYRYYTPGPGVLTVTTCEGPADFDTVLAVFNACDGAQLDCNDDACGGYGLQSVVSTVMAAGQEVYVRVAGYNEDVGAGRIRFSFDSADSCAHATDVADGFYPFDNTTAINDGGYGCNGYADVWYRYQATRYGWMDVSTCGLSGMDTVLGVFAACGGAELACNDDACGLQSWTTVPVVPGDVRLVRLSGYSGSRGVGRVQFSYRSNDNCADATPVGEGLYGFDTTNASTDGPAVCGFMENNVWFRYYSPRLGRLTVTTCDLAEFDTVLSAFDGCNGIPLACNDDAFCGPYGLNSTITFPVQRDSLSYISVGGYNGATGTGQVRVEFVPCRIDFNDDGFVDFFDYDDYVNCFETTNCPPGKTADFNGDDFVDFFDYDDFVTAFETGC